MAQSHPFTTLLALSSNSFQVITNALDRQASSGLEATQRGILTISQGLHKQNRICCQLS